MTISPVTQSGGTYEVAKIQTKFLRMESWTAELAESALHDKSKLGRMLGATVSDGFPNQPVRDYVLPSKVIELQSDPSRGVWSGIIIQLPDGTVIGSLGFKSPPNIDGMVEIGYDIIPAYQGNGYATEMARALIAWAFEQPSVKRITAECLPDNWASIRVLEKIGMRQVGSSADMLRWELKSPVNN